MLVITNAMAQGNVMRQFEFNSAEVSAVASSLAQLPSRQVPTRATFIHLLFV